MDGQNDSSRGMGRPCRAGLAAMFAVLFAGALRAGVIVVAPSPGAGVDFTSLPAAVAAAQDDDVILLKPGNYARTIVAGKGLTILGHPTGGTPTSAISSIAVRNVPAGSSVRIAEVRLANAVEIMGGSVTAKYEPLAVEGCGGGIVVQDVLLQYGGPFGTQGAAARIESSVGVVFARCRLIGPPGFDGNDDEFAAGDGGDGLMASHSNVFLHDSEVRGGPGGQGDGVSGADGGDALIQIGGVVASFASTFVGGNGGTGFVGDLIFGFFPSNGTGGAAGRISSGGKLTLQQTVLRAGKLAFSSVAVDPVVTDASSSKQSLAGVAALLEGEARLAEHALTEIAVHGAPGSPVIAFLGAGHTIVTESTILGALFVGPPAAAFALGTTDVGGVLRLSVVVPFLPAGVSAVPLTLQALLPATATGPEAFTNPLALVWLDSSY
jgi:hypothetical protein